MPGSKQTKTTKKIEPLNLNDSCETIWIQVAITSGVDANDSQIEHRQFGEFHFNKAKNIHI